ncbi:hypothetical protein GCM10022254_51840 [Actinomadura meridiana]|uniref:Sel1 repeat family protein n=1 Tax=Actinomadura meridiana TaxID=559626 RepID=A0ABP8CDS7_9ACTN
MGQDADGKPRGVDMFRRAQSYEAQGDLENAKRCYREAAESGHRAAAVVLGVLLASAPVASVDELFQKWMASDEVLRPAMKWWRSGIRGMNASFARELGQLLGWDPKVVETEHGLRAAFEAGDPLAGYQLARLLQERASLYDRDGFLRGARGWLREVNDLFDTLSEQTGPNARPTGFGSRWSPHKRRLRDQIYCYVLACSGKPSSLPSRYVPQRLEWEHGNGDVEATFLLGVSAFYPSEGQAERWFRTAAEAGHKQAAFELGAIRASSQDHEGADYWFRRAADAGHPGAAYQVAWDLCEKDPSAAEIQCGKAARAGSLQAAALLRVLQRIPRAAKSTGDRPSDSRVAQLLSAWDELSGLAPEADRCIDYLTEKSGLPRSDIIRVRQVRNQCAHPVAQGWPAQHEIDIALAIAEVLRKQISGS